jgi:hypothetical protein
MRGCARANVLHFKLKSDKTAEKFDRTVSIVGPKFRPVSKKYGGKFLCVAFLKTQSSRFVALEEHYKTVYLAYEICLFSLRKNQDSKIFATVRYQLSATVFTFFLHKISNTQK